MSDEQNSVDQRSDDLTLRNRYIRLSFDALFILYFYGSSNFETLKLEGMSVYLGQEQE